MRARTTAGAVVVVGIALLVGSIALVALLRDALIRDVRAVAQLRADEVAAAVASSGPPAGALPVAEDDEQLIQILDAGGAVVASSANVAGMPAVVRLRPGESATLTVPLDEGEFVAVASDADTPEDRFTVVVARTLTDAADATGFVGGLLAAGLPLLLLVVGVTTWKVVGRALAPVESIRGEVDAISGTALHRRVPAPPGGDEISRLAVTMNRMLERLEAAQLRQRRFTSDASHELRSPVASIRQHAEVALAHPDRTTVPELAATVLAEDLRVQRLVDDLLLLARADEGTLAGAHRDVDLDDLVVEEARRVRDAGRRVQVDIGGVSAGRVRGEPVQLRRMVGNLVDNAARHAHSRIVIGLGEHDGSVVLRVDDDGAGVSRGERERVFERFVRLDDARTRDSGGAGLGLAIVAEVASAHHGTVIATGAPAGGARFEVRLPLPPG